MMRLHSAALSERTSADASRWIVEADARERRGESTGLWRHFDSCVARAVANYKGSTKPTRLIGSRMLVIKAAGKSERGVIVVDYQYVFPLLTGLFDIGRIAERYHIVLEPSWAGCANPEILQFTRHPAVHVQTIEPHDLTLLKLFPESLIPVPLAANWWVDHRHTPTAATKDIDVIMVAAWADIKRHWRVFRALSELKRRGHRLRTVLVGYRYDRTKSDIEALARYFGVLDQIEFFERIRHEEVAALLGRSKVHVLWSRRECANRAIVEAMLADVPIIVRKGLTFGYTYPYINENTGRFVEERDLGNAILEMTETWRRYSPREWVLQNMTPERSTAVLEAHLREFSVSHGEEWHEGLAVRTGSLDTQHYWNEKDSARFAEDYRFLERCQKPG